MAPTQRIQQHRSGLPNENEWDITFDYRIEKGPLRGIWVRGRYAHVHFDSGGGHSNNVRLIINYPLSSSMSVERQS